MWKYSTLRQYISLIKLELSKYKAPELMQLWNADNEPHLICAMFNYPQY